MPRKTKINAGYEGKFFVVLEVLPKIRGRNRRCVAKCRCGKVWRPRLGDVATGRTWSCGCAKTKYGYRLKSLPEYMLWCCMRSRCRNPKYRSYGAKGVTVCERWQKSFVDFLADVGWRPDANHVLGRIDIDGDYKPANVVWMSRKHRQRSRRGCRMIGPVPFVTVAERNGIGRQTAVSRLRYGWSVEDAVSRPVRRQRRVRPRK